VAEQNAEVTTKMRQMRHLNGQI